MTIKISKNKKQFSLDGINWVTPPKAKPEDFYEPAYIDKDGFVRLKDLQTNK